MFGILVAVNPAEHSIVACLWTLRRLFKVGRCKIHILLVTGYTSEKYFIPLASCISSKVGQNRPGPVLAEYLKEQIQKEFSTCTYASDYEIYIETGCPVEKIRSFVLEQEIRVLVMGEKHPLSKKGTKWSNTVFSCVRECPCISLVVRPTCFDIVDTEPLIEIFRHPQLVFDDFGWWSDFLGVSEASQPLAGKVPETQIQSSIAKNLEPAVSTSSNPLPQAELVSVSKTKKQFFGNLLKGAKGESKGQSEVKSGGNVPDSDKRHFAGPSKKGASSEPSEVESKQMKGEESLIFEGKNNSTPKGTIIESPRRDESYPEEDLAKIEAKDQTRLKSSRFDESERNEEIQPNRFDESQWKNVEQTHSSNSEQSQLRNTEQNQQNDSEQNQSSNPDTKQSNNPNANQSNDPGTSQPINQEQSQETPSSLTPKSKWRSIHIDELHDKWNQTQEKKKASMQENQQKATTTQSQDTNNAETQQQKTKQKEEQYENSNIDNNESLNENTMESNQEPQSSPQEESEKKQRKSFFQKLLTNKDRAEEASSSNAKSSQSSEKMKEMGKQQFAGPSREK